MPGILYMYLLHVQKNQSVNHEKINSYCMISVPVKHDQKDIFLLTFIWYIFVQFSCVEKVCNFYVFNVTLKLPIQIISDHYRIILLSLHNLIREKSFTNLNGEKNKPIYTFT